ncbi:collagenase-like protein with putative collagen-binding domain [Pseudonocardia sediminis]|uniref:Collagenase-like protein with putative collagen-binding domain n=1 Tax=Pseudonocardia sediminis TaxID=1397368 RepID=A0A4Q7V089_PSEST|nr:transglycosylase family protein [Pseudonocardia sediminis]RZT87852.1 collagenase-like protein with putative collagen-binding domain [Pseudonocardia sediminis]
MLEHRGPVWRHAPAALGTALLVVAAVVGTQVALADAGNPRAPLSPYGEGGFTVGVAAVDRRITITSADDGSYVLGYTPAGGDVVLDLDLLSGDRAQPWWYDAATGRTLKMAALASAGVARFPVPKEGGGPAWVLVVDDVAAGYGSPDGEVVAQATGEGGAAAAAGASGTGSSAAGASPAGTSGSSGGDTTGSGSSGSSSSDSSGSDSSSSGSSSADGSEGSGDSGSMSSGSGSGGSGDPSSEGRGSSDQVQPGDDPASGSSPEDGRYGSDGGSGEDGSGEKESGNTGSDAGSGEDSSDEGTPTGEPGEKSGEDGGDADGSDSGSSSDGKSPAKEDEEKDEDSGDDGPTKDAPKAEKPGSEAPKEEKPQAEAPKSAPKTGQKASADPSWDKLAQCESTGNWAIDSGNGYYGGLQFDKGTWSDFGGTTYAPRADQATKEQQIEIATKVRDARGGYGSWPACSSKLGLPK